MDQVGLTLHPDKTRIVYCHDGRRRGCHEHTAFTFLGYTFRARGARNKNGKMFLSFLPAISKEALRKISAQVRSWRLHHRTGRSLADLAREINPTVRGWMNYYGAFYKSALYCLLTRINAYLLRWVRNKYRRLRGRTKARKAWIGSLKDILGSSPTGPGSTCPPLPDGQDDKSRVTGDCYARSAPRGASLYPRRSREELGGRFLDHLTYPEAKARWGTEHVRDAVAVWRHPGRSTARSAR
jgi:hypothetical protein